MRQQDNTRHTWGGQLKLCNTQLAPFSMDGNISVADASIYLAYSKRLKLMAASNVDGV